MIYRCNANKNNTTKTQALQDSCFYISMELFQYKSRVYSNKIYTKIPRSTKKIPS